MQITYNPTRNWTMKFTGGQQETVYDGVLKEYNALYNARFPLFTAAKAADYLSPQFQQYATYTTSGGTQVNLTNFLTSYGYSGAPALGAADGVDNVQKQYDTNVASQAFLAQQLQGQAAPDQRKYHTSFLTNYSFSDGALKGFSVGGSARWESKAVIGYYGKSSGANANPRFLDIADLKRPIYDQGNTYYDVWMAYTRRVFSDKVRMKIQLNIADVFENGSLRVVAVNYDGSPYAYRIIDPRKFILSTTFEF